MMSPQFSKLVDTPHYHLWTDALHARSLARQARNKWDRSTYVRWTVTTAWTAFEAACEEAVNAKGLGYRFKDNLDKAINSMSLPKINWSCGIWQQLLKIHKKRKDYIHPRIDQGEFFVKVPEAEKAIVTLRDGIEAIYMHAHKKPPDWVQDDEDRGWDIGRDSLSNSIFIHAGADEKDSGSIKIGYVQNELEQIVEVFPPRTDMGKIDARIEDIVQKIYIPISAIRVYRGTELIKERKLPMRGA